MDDSGDVFVCVYVVDIRARVIGRKCVADLNCVQIRTGLIIYSHAFFVLVCAK